MNVHAFTPVIVGIGEITNRTRDPSKEHEPLAMWAAALQAAVNDTGTDLLAQVDSIELVGSVTWRYQNPIKSLCQSLGINPAHQANASMGGETPLRLVHEAALKIARGDTQVAAIIGGESVNAINRAKKQQQHLDWTPLASAENTVKVANDRIETHKLSRRLGIKSPTEMYPLYETAYSQQLGITPDSATEASANLWQQYAEVAQTNPYAWIQGAPSAKEIAEVTQDNRMICWPYRKLMVANPSVNQSSAIILTSLEHAQHLGIDESKLIFLWGGAAANEPDNYLERDQYQHSSAQQACLDAAVAIAGGDAERFDFLELYSCFPVVPKMALQHLGLDAESINPTVAGGLTFFGGPLNNYMSHANCAMVRKLRENPSALGLLYGQGGFVTKHHSLVLSRQPSPKPLPENYSVQAIAESHRLPIPEFEATYMGPAKIETYTVLYARDGQPYQGVVVLRTAAGTRTLARVQTNDPESLAILTNEQHFAVGREGFVYRDPFGLPSWSLDENFSQRRNYQSITVTRDNHLTLITINRPEKLNCLNPQTNAELAQAFDDFEQDPEQWVAIITGAGDRAFCTGNDLKHFAKSMARGIPVETPETGYGGLTSRFSLNKPVIAAVNGAAMGGGFEVALACDLIIASDNASFALPEPKVGLAALAGGLLRLPRQIGLKHALGMILTGRTVSADEGLRLGFINQVVSAAELLPSARQWAEQLLACSPMSLKASKESVYAGLDQPLSDASAKQLTLPAVKALLKSSDMREGPQAFAEKRPPRWKNQP